MVIKTDLGLMLTYLHAMNILRLSKRLMALIHSDKESFNLRLSTMFRFPVMTCPAGEYRYGGDEQEQVGS